MVHQTLWQISIIFMSLVALVFLFVVFRSGKRVEDYTPIQKQGYKIRSVYFIVLLVFLMSVLVISMSHLPYDKPADAGEALIVDAEGSQFAWELSENKFEAGQLVEFHVTSKDVNHGFGIYDEDMKLIAQTQAMPGYTNKLYHVFEKPGKYQILCMEYCGVAHHYMIGEFEVIAKDKGEK